MCVTECEDREENESQKCKANSKTGPFSEFLSDRDIHHDRNDDIGDWNKEVTRTHVVLFKSPLLSKEDFNAFNLKYVSDSIATESSTYNYNTNDESLLSNISPDAYSYLAVAQSKTEALSLNREDWEIVGLYYNENDSTKPGILEISEESFV